MDTTPTTTAAPVKPVRYISRKPCPCGAGHSSALLVERAPGYGKGTAAVFLDRAGECGVFGEICVACRGCGRARRARAVQGRYSAKHTCNAKCLSSTGPACECSCGGKNHGAGWSA